MTLADKNPQAVWHDGTGGEAQSTGQITSTSEYSTAPAAVPFDPERYAMAERYLQLLDEEAESFTFQTFSDYKPAPRPDPLCRIIHGRFEEVVHQLDSLNLAGAGVFITVNETDGDGRKLQNIVRIRALWQDGRFPHIRLGMRSVRIPLAAARRFLNGESINPALLAGMPDSNGEVPEFGEKGRKPRKVV